MLPIVFKVLTASIEHAAMIERMLRNAAMGATILLVIATSGGVLQWLAPYNDVFVFGA